MSDSRVDRNLLFGVLALQMDFISRDALVAAMNAWVLEKSKPLGQILVEQHSLSAGDHEALNMVVCRHIERHQGDARQSLIALGSLGDVQQELEHVGDPDVHASLIHLNSAPPSSSWSMQTTLVPRDRQFAPDERFEILRPHASGGLGEVYVAQDHQLNREVALKRIHERHTANEDSRARFLLEAEITGGLEHPGIVPVYGMGASADGRPYYAMRMIRGETLKDAIKRFHSTDGRSDSQRRIALRQLLGRFIAVCNAVEYAHSRGVIHRDLKPSNIMLGKYGETLVVDWGLVKALGVREDDAPLDEQTLVPSSGSKSSETLPGSAIGTPAYMSPEQAAGRIDEVGPASDVYSLGATLYTLLTGKEPFEAPDVGAVLAKVQQSEFVRPRECNRAVPPPLDAICLKAMSVRPADRYASCAALASDIEHWLADEPVTAFADPMSARVGRWFKRHRGLAAGSAALLAALFVGLIIGAALLGRANARIAEEAAEADQQRQVAEERGEAATRQLYVSQMNLAQQAWEDNNSGRTRELLESQLPQHTGDVDLRGWEWHYLWRLTHSELRTLKFLSLCLAFTPDGRYLVSGSEDGTLKIWSADGTREVRTIKAHDQRIDRLAVSGDGKLLATRSPDGTVKLWDVATGRQVRSFPGDRARYRGLAINRDGSRLATSSNAISIWSTVDGKLIRILETQPPSSAIEFGPDGNQLVVGSLQDFAVRLWDLKTGNEIRRFVGHHQRITAVALSPDGQTLASASRDGTLRLWNIQSGQESVQIQGHSDRINRVVFSPDGRRLATACDDTTVKIWDTTTGEEMHTFRGHASPVSGVAYSPGADVVATGGWDGTIRLWDAASSQEPSSLRRPGEVASVAYSPDCRWLAAGGGGSIAVFDASTGLPRWSDSALLASWSPNVLRFDPAGQFLAFGSADGYVHLRDAKDGRPLRSFKVHDGIVTTVDFSPDGRMLATGSFDRSVRLWDAIDGRRLAVLQGHSDVVTSAVFSPNGKLLASVGSENDKQVILWDVATSQRVRSFVGHEGGVPCVIFSHDGRHIFTGSRDEMIRMWDVETGETTRVHRGHSGTVHSLSMSPDGSRLASCGSDQSVKIWDVATGQELYTLKTNAGQLISVAFSPDGTRLATGGSLRFLVVWDARPLTDELRADIVVADLVESLFADRWLKRDVLDALGTNQNLSKVVQRRALALTQQREESPLRLNELSWSVVSKPGHAADRYTLALRAAERAIELAKNGLFLNTLGVAQYRIGKYAEALETLARSDAANAKAFGGSLPADVAFLAMAHHQLGHAEQAGRFLEQLRELLQTDRWKADTESQAFFKEALELISPSIDAPVVAPRPTKP